MATVDSPLAGAWELVSETHVGIAIFTDRHFSMMAADANRSPFAAERPSDAEAAHAFHTMQAAGGTYELDGNTVVFHRRVNRHPSWTGQDFRWTFHIEGDRITMVNGRPIKNFFESRWGIGCGGGSPPWR